MPSKAAAGIVTVIAGVVIVGLLLFAANLVLAFGTVGEEEVHVETHWGEATGETYDRGQYWLGEGFIPNGISYGTDSVTTEPQTMTLNVDEGLSQDGQDVNAKVTVTYQVDETQAASFYGETEQSGAFTGDVEMWEDRIGEPAVESAVQDGASSISALEMVEEYDSDEGADMRTLRTELRDEVEAQLDEETAELSPEVQITQVRIEEVSLSDELDRGFEEIATESTEAERQLIDAQADAEAERERAEGQADAFDTIVEAYGSEDAALQAEWIEAIDEDEGTIIIDAEAAPILDLNEETDNPDDD